MKNTSVLAELTSLFDSAEEKLCPVLPSDSLRTPSTFLRIVSGENSDSGLRLVFELTHRYRDTEPDDSVEAFGYLQYLCSAAESTGKASVISFESGDGKAEGSVRSCSARFEYKTNGNGIRFLTDSSDLSAALKKVTLQDEGELYMKRYFFDSLPVRKQRDGGCSITLECTPLCGAEIMLRYSGEGAFAMCSVGGLAVRGDFVLGSFSVGDTVKCTLHSTGQPEYSMDF